MISAEQRLNEVGNRANDICVMIEYGESKIDDPAFWYNIAATARQIERRAAEMYKRLEGRHDR